MASAFLSSILSKTSQVLDSAHKWAASQSSSSDPRSGALEDLGELLRLLKRIQAVLHDAEEREIRDEAVKLWLKELKEVAYDAEDVLDEYHYEELRAQVEGGGASRKRKRVEATGVDDEEVVSSSLSTIVNIVSIPDGMGYRIRDIRKRFAEISEDRERLRLREEDGKRRVFGALSSPPPSSHMVDESSIYGREHDKQKVIDLLFSEDHMGRNGGISVLPIVGKGGLGKTTIAQLVYNDSEVKEYFDLTGWVCVSDDFDVPRLTKAIIESITEQSCDLTELSPLQNSLKKRMEGRNVLLVLDDVWNEQQSRWESLRIPFVGAEALVRIIVTCRNDSVAEIMQTVHDPYHPGYLSEDESWSLFKHYAFGGREPEEQPRLVDIGKQIVKKCSGLPLAVKTIGSLLRHETDEDSWMEVLQSDLWELDQNNEILASLRLSYNRMPAHLKPCFVYCSMFPKDHMFDRDVLVRLWMAQGYTPPRGRKTMEDIGDECFTDLLRRSFFDSYFGAFKMHDMIHDLAKFIAGNECYAIVEDKKLPDSCDHKVRHLYVQGEGEVVKSLSPQNLRALRTLLTVDRCGRPIVIQEVTQFLLIRCLQFSWEEVEIPDLLGNLKHLRYLRIASHCIKKLPESVCLLCHLQTLILDCKELKELPDGLGSLTNLRYFYIASNCIRQLPESACLLYYLQTQILDCKELKELPDGLGSLTNLRYLHISSDCIEKLPESVCLLYHLQTLILYCEKLEELPDGLGNLINLRYLSLSSSCIKRLPESVCHLRNLQNLHFCSCNQLKELPSGMGSLTALRHLEIMGTRQVLWLPAGIERLTNLQSLRGRFGVQGGIGVLKDLVNVQLQGGVCISGLGNLVSIEDAKDVGLKYEHKLEELFLHWDADCESDSCVSGLSLIFFPEERKDVPADEEGEEALLEYLQPPANLRKLLIDGYGGSKFPEWVGNPLSFASLREIRIIGCQNVRSLPLYIHDSMGELDASISKNSMAGVHNLHSLVELDIHNYPRLRLSSDEGLPSSLQNLHIEECQRLTSLPGLQNLTSLETLNINNCPQLQLLSEEGLPSSLKYLDIMDCQRLTSLSGLQDLTFLRALNINNCPQLLILSEEGLPSELEELHIEECQQLTSLPGLQNLTSLEELNINNCPQLRLLSEEGLPSKLQSLYKGKCHCQRLISLPGMQNLASLTKLTIKDCPKLQIMIEDHLSAMRDRVDIMDWPLLVDWCEILKINCIQVVSSNKLTISNTWEKIMHGFHDLTSTKHLYFTNSWDLLPESTFGISMLEELTMWGCTHIPPISCLPALTSLQCLVIKDCPTIRFVTDELLPSTLTSLVVDGCEDLRFLQLARRKRDALRELHIANCPKLTKVEGLNCIFFPRLLTIEQCPRLLLPHSKEVERAKKQSMIEPWSTLEKRVMRCGVIRHFKINTVSLILDAAADWPHGSVPRRASFS